MRIKIIYNKREVPIAVESRDIYTLPKKIVQSQCIQLPVIGEIIREIVYQYIIPSVASLTKMRFEETKKKKFHLDHHIYQLL